MLYGFIYEQFPVQNVFVKTKYKSTQSTQIGVHNYSPSPMSKYTN